MSLKHRHHNALNDGDALLVPMAAEAVSGAANKHTSLSTKRSSLSPKRKDGSTSCLPKLLLSLALVGVSACGTFYYVKRTMLERLQLEHQSEIEAERALSTGLKSKVDSLDAERRKIAQDLTAARGHAAGLEEAANAAAQQEKPNTSEQDAKIDQLVKYKKKIHLSLQQHARRQLLETFGPDPHRVEIQLAFDPESNVYSAEGGDRIVIEMAPASDMPYTVWWFLNQVDRGLYNMTSFHRNAGHVVQGGPTPNFLTPPDSHLVRRFEESGFDSVIFQEYSPNFPHNKYTLGYAGRPGGPDFYVSTMNNVVNHGPGGQDSYEDPSEADPCFAKVVSGFDAVDRMHKSAVKPGNYRRMEHFVAIKHMRILPPNEAVDTESAQSRR